MLLCGFYKVHKTSLCFNYHNYGWENTLIKLINIDFYIKQTLFTGV